MRDRDLYAQILGIRAPWSVTDVELDKAQEEVRVSLVAESGFQFTCPECAKPAPGYDTRSRSWRHLDTCQFKTILTADVPRVQCPEHGVLQVRVPWAEPGSGFTALFERLVIDWLMETSISAVARLLNMSWDEVNGVMERAVRRGLSRRKVEVPTRIGVDETSFQKRHEYVTVVCDLDHSRVLHVADDRRKESLDVFYQSLPREDLWKLRVVAMDMHQPYISSTQEHLLFADERIAFDKFHVAQHLGNAVDRVRRNEHRELTAQGDDRLKGTKYFWLENLATMRDDRRQRFESLRAMCTKVARAWSIRETAMQLWGYVSQAFARKAWMKWISWASRCRLEPIKRVAATIKNHLQGIVTAVVTKATNAAAESINAKIQQIKRSACGFRNRERFRNAIYFHLGGLDLYPTTVT